MPRSAPISDQLGPLFACIPHYEPSLTGQSVDDDPVRL
jgi:hypothetical protein